MSFCLPLHVVDVRVRRLFGVERRRRARRVPSGGPLRGVSLGLALLIAIPLALDVQSVSAYRGWCRADPQFLIDGSLVLVVVEAQAGDLPTARSLSTGPIEIVLTVPTGVPARLLASGNGFGYGYEVSIERSHDVEATAEHIPVGVAAYVPMTDSDVPVRVSFIPAGSNGEAPPGFEAASDAGNANGRPFGQAVLVAGGGAGTANIWITMTT